MFACRRALLKDQSGTIQTTCIITSVDILTCFTQSRVHRMERRPLQKITKTASTQKTPSQSKFVIIFVHKKSVFCTVISLKIATFKVYLIYSTRFRQVICNFSFNITSKLSTAGLRFSALLRVLSLRLFMISVFKVT